MRMSVLICAALLALSACGRNETQGVQRELEARAKADQAAVQAAPHSEPAPPPPSASDDANFLAAAKAAHGAVTTRSGLVYLFTHHTSNPRLPKPTGHSQVLVMYEGKLSNGHVFDSSFQRGEPAAFPLDGVVAGFSEVIQQMRPGDELIATFPPALGYGAQEQRNPQTGELEIPANAVLQFRIQLLAFQASPTSPVVQAPRS